MNDPQTAVSGQHEYRVEVGHCVIQVRSSSPEDAIATARQRFMRELPRLWDVIQRLDTSRFKVTML